MCVEIAGVLQKLDAEVRHMHAVTRLAGCL
jgi:hypothetical protein